MYFYHHYLQKGYKIEYLINLDFWTKQFMAASLEIELSRRNEIIQSGNCMPVIPY